MYDFINNNLNAVDWNSLISAVIGGVITGGFSLWAVDKAHKNDLMKEEQQEKLLIKGFVQSIKTEVQTLWDRYQEGIGNDLEALPQGQPLLAFYPVTQDYFTIYNGSSFLVGRIKNERLRNAIVKVYTQARGLIDSYRLNNDLIRELQNLDSLNTQVGGGVFIPRINAHRQGLLNYAPVLRELHQKVKESVENLLSILKDEGF